MTTVGPTNSSVAHLTELFAEYEQRNRELRGHHCLERAIDAATVVLLDDSMSELHESVRSLLATWFKRVLQNWPAHDSNARASPDALQLSWANHSLFNDPLFGLSDYQVDDMGWGEVAVILSKPYEKWTPKERRLFDDFQARLDRQYPRTAGPNKSDTDA